MARSRALVQLLMETDVDGLIGAGRHERTPERSTYRNGYRERALDTRLGSLQLRIPKLRQGSYFPPFLDARKTSEKALVAVIQEACANPSDFAGIGGVSTRRVDDLMQAMVLSGISKSTVSKLCKDIDDRVHAFLDRPLDGDWPYPWLDATSLKQREGVVHRFALHCLGCGHNRRGGQHGGQAGDRGAARRPERSRSLLGHVPAQPGQARPARHQAGDLGRA